ncbi:hypothetical protein [Nonomuraea glycinis]|jgi:hypothetical protein
MRFHVLRPWEIHTGDGAVDAGLALAPADQDGDLDAPAQTG